MNPGLYQHIIESPIQVGGNAETLRIVLPKAGDPPTVIDFRDFVGCWVGRCPGGTSADSIQVKCVLSDAASPSAGDMALPSAGTTVKSQAPIDSVPADKPFLINVDFERVAPSPTPIKLTTPRPQWTKYAFQWTNSSAGELIFRKVPTSSANR